MAPLPLPMLIRVFDKEKASENISFTDAFVFMQVILRFKTSFVNPLLKIFYKIFLLQKK